MPPEIPSLIVVVAIVGAQLLIALRSRRYAYADSEPALKKLEDRFTRDIQQRATRGLAPDWLRYQADIDRTFETRDERLRISAAAALAVGLGGTILALIVSLIIDPPEQGADSLRLVQGLGVALGGSLAGVINNLYIILRLLPRAEDRFGESVSEHQRRLQAVSDQHLPQMLFTDQIRDELSSLRESLQSQFSQAFSGAITGFPDVVRELGQHVRGLAQVVQSQGASIGGAIDDLKQCSVMVAAGGEKLRPAAEQLANSTRYLVAMPAQLQKVLEQSRNTWLESIREEQKRNFQQLVQLQQDVERHSREREQRMLAATLKMFDAVTEMRDEVSKISTQLASTIHSLADKLGREFGRQAHGHVLELSDELKAERAEFLLRIDGHEQEWRNNVGAVVNELFDQVADQIDTKLVEDLRVVSERIRESSELLPQTAKSIEASYQRLSKTHLATVQVWGEVGKQTRDAAQTMIGADGQLKIAVEALGQSTEHLERVAVLTSGFQNGLYKVLRQVTSQHLGDLKPIHNDMARMLKELSNAHGRMDGILVKQSNFIRACIDKLMKGRRVPTGRA